LRWSSKRLANDLSLSESTAADSTKDNKDATDLKHKDSVFIKNAAEGGLAEVELGQLAAQNAQNDLVKQLGQRIQADHSKANQEVQQIAQKVGVTVATELVSVRP
jgi:putative membrane protein